MAVHSPIHRRITRHIGLIIGLSVFAIVAQCTVLIVMERMKAAVWERRMEFREVFQTLSKFEANLNRMTLSLNSIYTPQEAEGAALFKSVAIENEATLKEMTSAPLGPAAETHEQMKRDFAAYVATGTEIFAQTEALGTPLRRGYYAQLSRAKNGIAETVTRSANAALFGDYVAMVQAEAAYRAALTSGSGERIVARDSLLQTLARLEAKMQSSSLPASAKRAFVATSVDYKDAVVQAHAGAIAQIEANQRLHESAAALENGLRLLRSARYAESNNSYVQENRYQQIDKWSVFAVSVGLCFGLAVIAVAMWRNIRKEAFFLEDRDRLLSDLALSETTIVWELNEDYYFTKTFGQKTNPQGTEPTSLVGKHATEVIDQTKLTFEGGVDFIALLDRREPFRDLIQERKLLDGTSIWRSVSAAPFFDEAGHFRGFRGTSNDISAQKLYERELKQTIAEFRDFATASSDLFWDIDKNGIVKAVGGSVDRAADMHDRYSGSSMISLLKRGRAFIEPGLDLVEHLVQGIPFRDLVFEVDSENATKRVWYRMSGFPYRDDNNDYAGMRCVTVDITVNKRLSLDLADKQRQLELLMSSFPVIAQRRKLNAEGGLDLIYVSPSIEKILGVPAADFTSHPPRAVIDDWVHPKDIQFAKDAAIESLINGTPFECTYRIILKDGSINWMLSRGVPAVDRNGEAVVDCFAVDVTEQVQREQALKLSEDRLSALIANVPGITLRIRVEGDASKLLYVSEGVKDFIGEPASRFVGPSADLKISHYFHPGDLSKNKTAVHKAAEELRPFEFKMRVLTPTGAYKWMLARGRGLLDIDGNIVTETLFVDIDEQVRKEEALKESEERLSALISNIPGLVYRYRGTHTAGILDYVSQGVEELTGFTVDEMQGIPLEWEQHRMAIFGDVNAYNLETIEHAYDAGEPFVVEHPIRTKSGEVRWLFRKSRKIKEFADGTFLAEGIAIDVTKKYQSEQRFAEVVRAVEQSRDAVYVYSRDDGFTFVNRAFVKLVGADSIEDVMGRRMEDVITLVDGSFDELYAEADTVLASAGYWIKDFSLITWRGERRDVQVRLSPLDPRRGLNLVVDLTEQKQFEAEQEKLRQAQEQRDRWLATVVAALDSSQDRIAIEDKNEKIIYANRALREVAGVFPRGLLGTQMEDVFPYAEGGPELYRTVREMVRSNGMWRGEIPFTRDSGQNVVYDARIVKTRDDGILFVGTDISERRTREVREFELRAQLAQAQKMEAIGRLAGGIAHDFNNILGATRTFASLLMEDLLPHTAQHSYASRIVSASDRAADLVRQILNFSRAKDASRELVVVSEVMREVAALLSGRLPENARFSITHPAGATVVIANASQLSQVLLNLAVNACDAIEDVGGEIVIGAEEVMVATEQTPPAPSMTKPVADNGEGFSIVTGQLKANVPYARISVSDSGVGIPRAIAQKILDPFFTTKERRRGSGLGLAVVNSIVAAYDGVIAVQSRVGVGTAFDVYLPAHKVKAADSQIVLPMKVGLPSMAEIRGNERILIVDDEVDMADAFSFSLSKLGYETAPIYSPLEALEIFKEDPSAWDLVITDQAMPDMKGLELIRKIKFIRPDIKTILCTGFSDQATEDSAVASGADSYFTKPLTSETLAASIRRLLGDAQQKEPPV